MLHPDAYDDCKNIAREKNLPIAKIYREVYKVIEKNEEYEGMVPVGNIYIDN
ncbi:hypothetical protein DSBG_2752 [Desulfosporosinus sp. BG]|nr:hypothetical protein DSBG_2752 [Desulfosporosinus sp. BG]